MANLKTDEMAILKAVSIKLSEDVVLIATLQYHTEVGNRAASRYRWVARVANIQELRELVSTLKQDQSRLLPWRWPNDPSWNGKIFNGVDSNNYARANWIRVKLNKMVDREEGIRLLNGWKPAKKEYNLNAKYDTVGYTATDGSTVDITDFDTLLTKVNQTFVKEQNLKRKAAEVETQTVEVEVA